MKTFFRKHWLKGLWILLFSASIFLFLPRLSHFYLASDKENLSSKIRIVLTWFTPGLFALILIIVLWKTRQISSVLRVAFPLALLLFFYFIILRDCLLAAGLYVNRWADRGVVTRTYLAEYLEKNPNSETNLYLFQLPTKHLTIEDVLMKTAYHSGVKHGDTICVTRFTPSPPSPQYKNS